MSQPSPPYLECKEVFGGYHNVQVASSEGFVIAADIASNNCENDLKEMAQALECAMENTPVAIEKATAD